MNKMFKKIAQSSLLLLLIANVAYADWTNDMMQAFEFSSNLDVNQDYPFDDGSNPTWATLATFEIDTSSDDSGFVLFNAALMMDGISQVQGVVALRVDNNILGLGVYATDGWGIGKFTIHAPSVFPPAQGWSTYYNMYWPLTTALLGTGTHTVELIGSWVYSDFVETGWHLNAGAMMTFVGFANSSISQVS